MSLRVEKYHPELKAAWDLFIKEAKNSIFLFNRDYMEYHADRFLDHSLLFYYDDELLCVLPAAESSSEINSHAGLTYGGFIMSKRATASFMLSVTAGLISY